LPPSDQPSSPDVQVEIRPARAPQFAAIVSLLGEHDLATAPALRETLAPFLGDLLVDLSECTFVDSTVIGALIACAQQLQREGHALSLVVPPENANIARTLDIVRIRELVRVHARLPGADAASSPGA
jgi:anti-anti-sigma factor